VAGPPWFARGGGRGSGQSDDGIFALTHHRCMETWGLSYLELAALSLRQPRAALPRQRRRRTEQRIARVGPGQPNSNGRATAPKHFSSNSTAPAALHPATFRLFVPPTLLSVVNMADISTLSKLLEASLDPRQNKQGRSLFLSCVYIVMLVPHCPSLPALKLQTPH
jgi:hypothetical protein